MDFSRADATLIASRGRETSISFLRGAVIVFPFCSAEGLSVVGICWRNPEGRSMLSRGRFRHYAKSLQFRRIGQPVIKANEIKRFVR